MLTTFICGPNFGFTIVIEIRGFLPTIIPNPEYIEHYIIFLNETCIMNKIYYYFRDRGNRTERIENGLLFGYLNNGSMWKAFKDIYGGRIILWNDKILIYEVLRKINNQYIYSLDDLRKYLYLYKPGEKVNVTIQHIYDAYYNISLKESGITRSVTLSQNPKDPEKPFLGIFLPENSIYICSPLDFLKDKEDIISSINESFNKDPDLLYIFKIREVDSKKYIRWKKSFSYGSPSWFHLKNVSLNFRNIENKSEPLILVITYIEKVYPDIEYDDKQYYNSSIGKIFTFSFVETFKQFKTNISLKRYIMLPVEIRLLSVNQYPGKVHLFSNNTLKLVYRYDVNEWVYPLNISYVLSENAFLKEMMEIIDLINMSSKEIIERGGSVKNISDIYCLLKSAKDEISHSYMNISEKYAIAYKKVLNAYQILIINIIEDTEKIINSEYLANILGYFNEVKRLLRKAKECLEGNDFETMRNGINYAIQANNDAKEIAKSGARNAFLTILLITTIALLFFITIKKIKLGVGKTLQYKTSDETIIKIEGKKKFCPYCGAENPYNSKKCIKCGRHLQSNDY